MLFLLFFVCWCAYDDVVVGWMRLKRIRIMKNLKWRVLPNSKTNGMIKMHSQMKKRRKRANSGVKRLPKLVQLRIRLSKDRHSAVSMHRLHSLTQVRSRPSCPCNPINNKPPPPRRPLLPDPNRDLGLSLLPVAIVGRVVAESFVVCVVVARNVRRNGHKAIWIRCC